MDPKAIRAQAAISQKKKKKPFETLSSYGVTSENKSIHTHPPSLHPKEGGLLFLTCSSNSGATLHGVRGEKESLIFPFLSWQIIRKDLSSKVSHINLVANCCLKLCDVFLKENLHCMLPKENNN